MRTPLERVAAGAAALCLTALFHCGGATTALPNGPQPGDPEAGAGPDANNPGQ